MQVNEFSTRNPHVSLGAALAGAAAAPLVLPAKMALLVKKGVIVGALSLNNARILAKHAALNAAIGTGIVSFKI